jgi:hypothetical protein
VALVLAFAAFAVVMAIVIFAVHPRPIPGFRATQRQSAETALYLVALCVLLPASLLVAHRLARSISSSQGEAALSLLAAVLAAGLAAAIVVARLSHVVPHGGGKGAVLIAALGWWLLAAPALARAARPHPWRALVRAAPWAGWAWAASAALALGSLLTVTDLRSVSPLPLVLGAGVLLWSFAVAPRRVVPRLRRPWAGIADAGVLAALLLAVPNLTIIRPEDRAATPLARIVDSVVQFHQDLFLGPANQVLAGKAMLVDTVCQYGVGSVYLLAGWFKLAPIGYGTYGLLDGILTALLFAAGYCVLRLAGCSRVLAGAALAVGVIALVYNRLYPVGQLPQEGPLRFGLPLALVLAATAGARFPRYGQAAGAAALVVLAVSSIWALEGFGYTAVTFAAIAGVQAYLLPSGCRVRWLVGRLGLALGACVAAHVVFAAATLAATGRLPDWPQYLAYLHAFLLGGLGDLTYDFSFWSAGLAVGALYLGAAAALVLLLRLRPGVVRHERAGIVALTGTTAYGLAMFGYFVDRSANHVLVYVSLPAVLIGAVWLNLVLRARPEVTQIARRGALAVAVALATLLVSVGWSSIRSGFDESALGMALPGGDSMPAALKRLWRFPPIQAAAPAGERLLARYMPGERRSLVLVQPDLSIEILMRSHRGNELPIGDAWEDSFVPGQRRPVLRRAVTALRSGARMLVDTRLLAAARSGAGVNQIAAPGSDAARLQLYTLEEIGTRFGLRALHRDAAGFVVVELTPRR